MQERRQYPRFIPDSSLLVSLNSSRRGFLSDLSLGGVAFEGFLPQTSNEAIEMAFRLPGGGDTIEAKGEVVWTDDSRQQTGVRFVELAQATEQKLRQWLSLRVFILGEKGLEGLENPAQTPPADLREDARARSERPETATERLEPQLFVGFRPARIENEARSRAEQEPIWYSPGFAVGAVVVCLAFVALGYYLPSFLQGPKPTPTTEVVESSAGPPPPSVQAPRETSPASQPSRAPQAPVASAGFVLQVGAMTHKENADALVDTLRKKNFPAFVVARGGDRFFRVDVGPYPDATYARGVRDELKADGFATVLERRFGPPSR